LLKKTGSVFSLQTSHWQYRIDTVLPIFLRIQKFFTSGAVFRRETRFVIGPIVLSRGRFSSSELALTHSFCRPENLGRTNLSLLDRSNMANRTNLRSNLRAADKRRQRRVESFAATSCPNTPTHSQVACEASVDATDAIVWCAVGYCQSDGRRLDAVLVGGLRGYFKQAPPQRVQAKGLYDRLCSLADELVQTHPGFAVRQFRTAVQQLLDTASIYESGNPHDTRFLDYLELLSRG
jgi:hypothetical protein